MSNKDLNYLVSFLSDVSFFSEVSQNSLSQLCESINIETFRKNETIFKKGDVGNAMYVVLNGKVKVHDGAHIYDEFEVGDCFGEYARNNFV